MYSKEIPQILLDENPSLSNFVKVLDGMEDYKTQSLEKAFRFVKNPLYTDLAMLRKKVEGLGYVNIPGTFTKEQLDALALNAGDVMACKGSREGLYLWLWCITFGAITLDMTSLIPNPNYIIPSDVTFGYVSNVNPPDSSSLYLFSGADNFGSSTLFINIATKYYAQSNLEDYIRANIENHLGFLSYGATINITLTSGPYVTSLLPYQYFVK